MSFFKKHKDTGIAIAKEVVGNFIPGSGLVMDIVEKKIGNKKSMPNQVETNTTTTETVEVETTIIDLDNNFTSYNNSHKIIDTAYQNAWNILNKINEDAFNEINNAKFMGGAKSIMQRNQLTNSVRMVDNNIRNSLNIAKDNGLQAMNQNMSIEEINKIEAIAVKEINKIISEGTAEINKIVKNIVK